MDLETANRKESGPKAADSRERAIIELHFHYLTNIWSLNDWKVYSRYKKHLPRESRFEVDQLVDLMMRKLPREMRAKLDAIFARIWDADDLVVRHHQRRARKGSRASAAAGMARARGSLHGRRRLAEVANRAGRRFVTDREIFLLDDAHRAHFTDQARDCVDQIDRVARLRQKRGRADARGDFGRVRRRRDQHDRRRVGQRIHAARELDDADARIVRVDDDGIDAAFADAQKCLAHV